MRKLLAILLVAGCAASTDDSTTGSTTSSSGAGGSEECTAGATEACYGGPAEQAGVGICIRGTRRCPMTAPFVWGACEGWVPAGAEACDQNELDDNCDGSVDEGCPCNTGDTKPCGSGAGECSPGTQSCTGGRWGACEGGVGPKPEVCSNDLDDDCDRLTDCADANCAADPACTGNCNNNGVCDSGENATTCPCDCSGCMLDTDCSGTTPLCCIPCGCNGPALQCVPTNMCCG